LALELVTTVNPELTHSYLIMKIPPLTEMEPLPPVPELPPDIQAEITAMEEIGEELYELSGESDVENDDMPRPSTSQAGATMETGSLLDISLQQEESKPSSPRQSPRGSNSSRLDFLSMPYRAFEKAEELARRVWAAGWMVVHHNHLPKWLRDNDFLVKGHRPPMNSYWKCFKSIFRVHTETGNIWTHLLGSIAFTAIAIYFVTRPTLEVQWQEKAIFSAFFVGAILCLTFSWMFHTVYCHSQTVGRFFNKLDYCGIALLTMGSFVPWLYYSFYCRLAPKLTYLIAIFILGTFCIVVSMWDKFAEPKFRPVRAGVFIGLGLSGVIPAMHIVITDGFYEAIYDSALGWLTLMAVLYIVGAVIYAARIPERIWPGRFDIWCQSHQIFHMFVLVAAFVHYHGISQIAMNRLTYGDCTFDHSVLPPTY
jgi:adiponectin receptor